MASHDIKEENRISQTVSVVASVEQVGESNNEEGAICTKDSSKNVSEYLSEFHTSPWLRMDVLPRPPCTSDSTSCEEYHGEGKTAASELSWYYNYVMTEMINSGFVLEAFQLFQCDVSRTHYPSVQVIGAIIREILNTNNLDVLASAQYLLGMLVELHPPCAYQMGVYYEKIILDGSIWTNNGNEEKQGVFYYVTSKLEVELNRKVEVNSAGPSTSAVVNPEGRVTSASFMDAKAEHSYEDLSVSDRLKRLWIVFNFVVDLMEHDLVVWLVKHRSQPQPRSEFMQEPHPTDKPSILEKEVAQPLIVSAISTNAYSSIGSASGICERLIKVYLKCFSFDHEQVHFKTFHRIFALIVEGMNATEQQRLSKPLSITYGIDCENFARKFLEHISCADLNDTDFLYMLKSLKPPWLQYYLCDSQILNKFFQKDNIPLVTMRKNIIDTYKSLQKRVYT